MAMTDRTGRTRLVCLKCEDVDPLKTDVARWANSPLADSARNSRNAALERNSPGKQRGPCL